MPIRVLVVDDFEPFRAVVRDIIGDGANLPFQIICEARDGLEAVRRAEELIPDLVLLDVSLPEINGLEAARQIRMKAPKAKILFLSQHRDPSMVLEALSTGAYGYVVKPEAGVELLPAMQAVLSGRYFISRGIEGHDLTDSIGQVTKALCDLERKYLA